MTGGLRFLAPVGLHVTQFSILAKLKRLGPTTINGMAKEMVIDRTTLGRNVLPLERDGLIKIEASATDGRAKELYLTKAGEKRLLAGREVWEQAQTRFDSRFGAKVPRTSVPCCGRSSRATSRPKSIIS
jgi:DNA-binding MarR family transcriptional regulator